MVLPIASVSVPIKKLRYISVILSELIPKLSGKLKKMAIAATVGMVRPMLANAEPRARFKLLWRRLARAARTAAYPSGISTNSAMAIPTTVLGAPADFTPASMAGLSASAKPTTTARDRSNRKALTAVLRLLGSSAWISLSVFLSSAFGR